MDEKGPPGTPEVDAPELPALARRVVDRYVRAFAPERIVLFGSFAKGTNHPDSDIDLLVVADVDDNPASHLRRARQLAADCFPRIDVVMCTPQDVAEAEEETARSPFILSVLGSGVTVYRRG